MDEAIGASGSGLRSQVDTQWKDLAAGRLSRAVVAAWAERLLEEGAGDEELVIQGLLFLQTVNFVPGNGDAPVARADGSDAPFLISGADICTGLRAWHEDLERFDADPHGWMRRHFQRVVREFAKEHGVGRGRSFAEKLVASGELGQDDLPAALGPVDQLPVPQETTDPRRSRSRGRVPTGG